MNRYAKPSRRRSPRSAIPEDSEHHDRWLVSYADFITLLFAFFVVMYSISSINEGKYRVLAESIGTAFSKHEPVALLAREPIQIGDTPPRVLQPIALDPSALAREDQAIAEAFRQERETLRQVSEQFTETLDSFIEQRLVEVKRTDYWLELEMKSGLLFESGKAELSPDALPVLRKIAEIIRETPNVLHVEGHTDNIPIRTVEFASNWELSAARAASVVREFIASGIAPERLAAVGYGEYHPVADNRFEEGRFKNRRVVLVLMSQALARYPLNAGERGQLRQTTPALDERFVGNGRP